MVFQELIVTFFLDFLLRIQLTAVTIESHQAHHIDFLKAHTFKIHAFNGISNFL